MNYNNIIIITLQQGTTDVEKRAIMDFNGNLLTRCGKTSLRAVIAEMISGVPDKMFGFSALPDILHPCTPAGKV